MNTPPNASDAGSITRVAGIEVGHFTDTRRPTGCTAILARQGAVAGVDVRGAAPGTRETDLLRNIEREFLRFQAELPLQYVRREDYVRGQSVIEAKLDALYNKLEVVQMKGANNG